MGRSGCAFTPALRLRSGQSGSAYGAPTYGPTEVGPFRFGLPGRFAEWERKAVALVRDTHSSRETRAR
jgi:hypothetical protein